MSDKPLSLADLMKEQPPDAPEVASEPENEEVAQAIDPPDAPGPTPAPPQEDPVIAQLRAEAAELRVAAQRAEQERKRAEGRAAAAQRERDALAREKAAAPKPSVPEPQSWVDHKTTFGAEAEAIEALTDHRLSPYEKRIAQLEARLEEERNERMQRDAQAQRDRAAAEVFDAIGDDSDLFDAASKAQKKIVHTPEFRQWLQANPDETELIAHGIEPDKLLRVVNRYRTDRFAGEVENILSHFEDLDKSNPSAESNGVVTPTPAIAARARAAAGTTQRVTQTAPASTGPRQSTRTGLLTRDELLGTP